MKKIMLLGLILFMILIAGCTQPPKGEQQSISQQQTTQQEEKVTLAEDCMVAVGGFIFRNDTAIVLGSWGCSRPAEENYTRGSGDYSIVLLDKNENILDEFKFSINWYREGILMNTSIFADEIPAKKGTSEILVKHFDKILLREPLNVTE